MTADLETLSIDTIRCLAMDAVQKANAGHPGTAMALAPVAYVLYRERMTHDPADPSWVDRDRFVLSAGHACILQYAALHLTGYDLTIDDLQSFRQFGSRTPGHPELHETPGVEITTGPLGQGVGNAVGMALCEAMLAERYNREGHAIVDHRTYSICSDGDLMEGVSGEASSLAGHLGLGKLCLIYDQNHITIEGDTALAFSEDVGARYEAYGFYVQHLADGWAVADLRLALDAADAETSRPSLIVVRTHIAPGAPHAHDTPEAHGAPLGEDEVRLTKQAYGWDPDLHFHIPDGVYEQMGKRRDGAAAHARWNDAVQRHAAAYPELAAQFARVMRGQLPAGWEGALPDFAGASAQATRASSGSCIAALAAAIPELVGGSADLAPSNNTTIEGGPGGGPLTNREISKGDAVLPGRFGGRVLHFGIREHGMGAILNGMAAHGGLRAFGATFLVFADYMRGSVRLASLMRLPVVYVWTHDSIMLGEDGPTHQPIETIMALRMLPGMRIIRPADATETAEAWRLALEHDGPVGLALSRQKLPVLDRSVLAPAAGVRRGAYVLADAAGGPPDTVLIGTGAEVHELLAAREQLASEGIRARVVSMPDWNLFEQQDDAYIDEVLPPSLTRRVSLEAGTTFGWSRFVGRDGIALGIDRFGASAPASVLAKEYGITAEAVVAAVRSLH